MKSNTGFSLLEIIIAITIIAIFTVLPILAYTSYQKKARDEKRKSDLGKISQALESYKAEKGTYPPDLSSLVASGYIPEVPIDPLNGQSVPWDITGGTFKYDFSSPDGSSYTLSAKMEVGGASGGNGSNGGSGSSSFPGGNIAGIFTGTGGGSISSTTISVNGIVTNNIFKGSFNGSVSGNGINGTINGTLNSSVTGTAQGNVSGTATVTAGTVNGTQFVGTYSGFNVTGVAGGGSNGGGGTVCVSTPTAPSCVVYPVLTLTLGAQQPPTAAPPTATGYVSPTIIGTITATPSPTNTPTPSNTPTNTPTRTPTPIPSNTPTRTPTPTTPPYKIVFSRQTTPPQIWTMSGDGQGKGLYYTLPSGYFLSQLRFGANTSTILFDQSTGSTTFSLMAYNGVSTSTVLSHNGVVLYNYDYNTQPLYLFSSNGLYSEPISGGSATALYTNGTIYSAGFASSGYKVAYAKRDWAAGNDDLYYISDWRTPSEVRLTTSGGGDARVSEVHMNPAGTKVVYSYLPPGWTTQNQEEIYLYNLSTGTNTRLTNNSIDDVAAVFTRTGTEIVYMQRNLNSSYSTTVNIMNEDGAGQRALTSNDSGNTNCSVNTYYANSTVVSPDNNKIVYSCSGTASQNGIYTMNRDGSGKVLLDSTGSTAAFSY